MLPMFEKFINDVENPDHEYCYDASLSMPISCIGNQRMRLMIDLCDRKLIMWICYDENIEVAEYSVDITQTLIYSILQESHTIINQLKKLDTLIFSFNSMKMNV